MEFCQSRYRNSLLNSALALLAAISITLGFTPAYAQESAPEWQITPEPEWASQAALTKNSKPRAKGGIYYNLIERHHRYGETSEDYSSYIRYVFSIVNSAGLESGSQLSVDFDPDFQTVKLHKVIVHRGDERINQLDGSRVQLLQRETDLDDGLYNGEQTLHMLLPDQRVGDKIEISYTVKGRNPIFDNSVFGWSTMQSSVDVGSYYFVLHHPARKEVAVRTYAGELQAAETLSDNYKTLTWAHNNVPGRSYQSNVPSSYFAQTAIQYSEFKTWADVANWATPLYQNQAHASDAIKAKAATFIANYSSLDEQVSAAITFVQDEVRYTGINNGIRGYVPDNPTDILQRRFGDCKDKAVLLVALLQELGVTAYPVLVHSNNGKGIKGELPSPGAFNHMITQLPDYNGKTYWIDGTVSAQGSSLNSLYQIDYHTALIPAQSHKGLVDINNPIPTLPEKEVTETYLLQDNHESKPTTLTINTLYRGYEAERLRVNLQNNGEQHLEGLYYEYYQDRFDQIDLAERINITDDRQANTIKVIEVYSIPEAFELDSDDGNIQEYSLGVFAEAITGDLKIPSDKRRRQPLHQIHPVNVKHTIVLVDDSGWDIPDETYNIENQFFEYRSANRTIDNRTLELSYSLRTLSDYISVQDSKRYIKDLRKMLDSPYYSVNFHIPVEDTQVSSFDTQINSIGSWFRENIEQLAEH